MVKSWSLRQIIRFWYSNVLYIGWSDETNEKHLEQNSKLHIWKTLCIAHHCVHRGGRSTQNLFCKCLYSTVLCKWSFDIQTIETEHNNIVFSPVNDPEWILFRHIKSSLLWGHSRAVELHSLSKQLLDGSLSGTKYDHFSVVRLRNIKAGFPVSTTS